MRQTRAAVFIAVPVVTAFLTIVSTCSAGVYSLDCNAADYGLWARQVNPGDALENVQVIGTPIVYRVGFGGNPDTERGTDLFCLFSLPTLAANEIITSATLGFQYTQRNGTPDFNIDLWGTGFQANTSPMQEYFQYDSGDPDATNVKIQDNLLVPTSSIGSITSSADAALSSYLNSFYAATPGYAGGTYVFLRLNPDGGFRAAGIGYHVQSPADVTLTLTTAVVPEPSTWILLLLGALAVGGRWKI